MNRRAGFTLVEMVLVIVLTGILTAASIGSLRGVQSWRSAAGVRRMHADLNFAREQALLSGRRTLCVLDYKKKTYELRQEATPGTGTVAATAMDHPLTGEPWVVYLEELSSSSSIASSSSAQPTTFGFGADGNLIATSGTPLKSDLALKFSNGATLTIYAGSGLNEVSW